MKCFCLYLLTSFAFKSILSDSFLSFSSMNLDTDFHPRTLKWCLLFLATCVPRRQLQGGSDFLICVALLCDNFTNSHVKNLTVTTDYNNSKVMQTRRCGLFKVVFTLKKYVSFYLFKYIHSAITPTVFIQH